MREKIRRKTIGKICALVVVGMFVAMTPMSVSANPDYWDTTGNEISSGDYLGTTNAEDLVFKTNTGSDGSTKMIIKTDGKVGIGTASPTAKTHIIQTASDHAFRVDDEASDTSPFVIDQNGDVGIGSTMPFKTHKLVIMDGDTLENRAGMYVLQAGAMTGGTGYGIYICKTGASTTNVAGYFSASEATNNYGLIVADGNVGIGTTSPNEKLVVSDGNLKMNSGNIMLNGNWLSGDGGSEGIYVDSSGQVGIGTTNPETKLHVGGILTVDQKITAGDYSLELASSDGKTRLIVYGGGNVGIGTLWPCRTLHVETTGSDRHIRVKRADGNPYLEILSGQNYCALDCCSTVTELFAILENGDTRLHIKKGGNVGIMTTTPDSRLEVKGAGTDSATSSLHVTDGTGASLLFVRDDGNVGIGTTNPEALLDLSSSGNTKLRFTDQVVSTYYIKHDGAEDSLSIGRLTGGGSVESNYLTVDDNGNVGIRTPRPGYNFEVESSDAASGTEYLLGAFDNSVNGGGVYLGYLGDGTGASEARVRSGGSINLAIGTTAYPQAIYILNSNGNVGIGTVPDAELHIAGSIKIVDGTENAGYVLTSDADGLASWQNVGVPSGAIIMWSGATVPDGWALCDGTQNTPDLTDRFIVGAGNSYSIGNTGGANTNNIQHSHTYSGTTGTEPAAVAVDMDDPDALATLAFHTHDYSGTTDPAGSTSLENRPPYFALAFIMKL